MNQGTLLSIHIAREAAGSMTSLASVRAIPGRGLEDDRYARGAGTFSHDEPSSGREVTLIASEMLDLYARERGTLLEPADARRNLVTRGVSLNDLVGKIFRVGDVRLKGVRLAEPCKHLERLTHRGVAKGLVHRGGLRADVLDEGVLRVGDDIREIEEAVGDAPSRGVSVPG